MAQPNEPNLAVAFTPRTRGYLKEVIPRGASMVKIPDVYDGNDRTARYLDGLFAGVTAFPINNHGADVNMGNMVRFADRTSRPGGIPDNPRVMNAVNVVTTNRFHDADESPYIPHWLWCVPERLSMITTHFKKENTIVDRWAIHDQHELELSMRHPPTAPDVMCDEAREAAAPPLLRGEFVVSCLGNRERIFDYRTVSAFRRFYGVRREMEVLIEHFQRQNPHDILPTGMVLIGILNYWYERTSADGRLNPDSPAGRSFDAERVPSLAEYLVYFVVCVTRAVTMGIVLIPDPLEFAHAGVAADKKMARYYKKLPVDIKADSIDSERCMALLDNRPPKRIGRLLTSDLMGAGQPPIDQECPILKRYMRIYWTAKPRVEAMRPTVNMIGETRTLSAGRILDDTAEPRAVVLPIGDRRPWHTDALEIFEDDEPSNETVIQLAEKHRAKIYKFASFEPRPDPGDMEVDDGTRYPSPDLPEPGVVDFDYDPNRKIDRIGAAIDYWSDLLHEAMDRYPRDPRALAVAVQAIGSRIQEQCEERKKWTEIRDGLRTEEPPARKKQRFAVDDGGGGDNMEKNRKNVWHVMANGDLEESQARKQLEAEELKDWNQRARDVQLGVRVGHLLHIPAKQIFEAAGVMAEAEAADNAKRAAYEDGLHGNRLLPQGWQRPAVSAEGIEAFELTLKLMNKAIGPVPQRYTDALKKAEVHLVPPEDRMALRSASPLDAWRIMAEVVTQIGQYVDSLRRPIKDFGEGRGLTVDDVGAIVESLKAIYGRERVGEWFDGSEYKLNDLCSYDEEVSQNVFSRLLQWHQMVSKWALFCMYALNGAAGKMNEASDSRPCSWNDMRDFADGIIAAQEIHGDLPATFEPTDDLNAEFTQGPVLHNRLNTMGNEYRVFRAKIKQPYEEQGGMDTPLTFRFPNVYDFFANRQNLTAREDAPPREFVALWTARRVE